MDITIYRRPGCPWGDKAIELIRSRTDDFEEHVFASRAEEDAFKAEHSVETTPQIWIDGERVGGYTDLAARWDEAPDPPQMADASERSYVPVIAVFAVAAMLALVTRPALHSFMGFALCLLALLKLMDLRAFARGFVKYDLLAARLGAYGLVYPFAELAAGLGFLWGGLPKTTGALSLTVGLIGAISVFKAVYIDKRDLNCACVGGNSKVPLGAVSLTENLMMFAMGAWWLLRF